MSNQSGLFSGGPIPPEALGGAAKPIVSVDIGRSTWQGPAEEAPRCAVQTDEVPSLGTPITMTYRNYRGEIDQRTIVPSRIWFGSTDWHPEPGWLMSAYDLAKAAHRDFALADCQFADLCASGQQVRALTLSKLQAAHVARQDEWCPGQKPDLSFRGNELGGECGEAQNVIKKLERERHGWRGSRDTVDHLAEELADVIHCAVLVAITAGIDIEPAVVAKFNDTSEKNGLSTRLAALTPAPQAEGEAIAVAEALRELVAACEAYPVNIARADTALDNAHAALRALKGGNHG
ncbi:MAG: hypothetical protein Q4615_04900 [Paracoccus aminovorans]|nr:hypothetical protein [Paracoccus aminovorans]